MWVIDVNPDMSRQDLMREVGRMWKEKKGELVEDKKNEETENEEVVEEEKVVEKKDKKKRKKE
jgi:hypothetical protein